MNVYTYKDKEDKLSIPLEKLYTREMRDTQSQQILHYLLFGGGRDQERGRGGANIL